MPKGGAHPAFGVTFAIGGARNSGALVDRPPTDVGRRGTLLRLSWSVLTLAARIALSKELPMPLPQSFVEATERRIRVRLADEVVADTQRALLLVQYGPGALPTYYIPASDVRPGVLVDEARAVDGRRLWSVVCKGARADGAAVDTREPHRRLRAS